MQPLVAITLDIDWAPDFVIDHVAQILVRDQVKCTWFVTHSSPAVDRLRLAGNLFELGIHPNFLAGSTQGKTPAEVLAFCRRCVPKARSMRTHSLVQSSPLLASVMAEGGIERDVSLYLPYHRGLQPVRYRYAGRDLWRIPYFWEDDFEMEQVVPDWDLLRLLDDGASLAVFDFHPIHVYLNSASMQPYQALKRAAGNLAQASAETVASFVQKGAGAGTAFSGLVRHVAQARLARTIAEIPIPADMTKGVAA